MNAALEGKVVVITGAGRGLGAAYAKFAAAQGAKVLVNDIDVNEAEIVVREIHAEGGIAVADGADISNWSDANALIDRCLLTFDGIDGLCDNAAVFSMASVLEEDPEVLRRMIEVNLLGTAHAGMAAARAMKAQRRGGVILNTVSGAQSGSENMFAYAASKGGIASMTYSWALDLAPHGIRVNAISPLAHTRTAISIEPSLHKDKPPDIVAPLAVYLLSDLSAAVNGQVVFLGGNELSLVSHPALVMPSLERDRWTLEDLVFAFATEFAGQLLPVGRSRQEIKVLLQSDAFDVKDKA